MLIPKIEYAYKNMKLFFFYYSFDLFEILWKN